MWSLLRLGGRRPSVLPPTHLSAGGTGLGLAELLLLRPAASPRLLFAYARDLLDDIVIDVGISDDLTTAPIGVPQDHLDGLLIVWDFFPREITHQDRLPRHSVSSIAWDFEEELVTLTSHEEARHRVSPFPRTQLPPTLLGCL